MKWFLLFLFIVVIWASSKIASLAIEYHFQEKRLQIEREALHERSKANAEMTSAIKEATLESIKRMAE